MTHSEVMTAMRAGARLHMEHTEDGDHFWLSHRNGLHGPHVRPDTGRNIIEDPSVIRCDDALFDKLLPQTYLIEA